MTPEDSIADLLREVRELRVDADELKTQSVVFQHRLTGLKVRTESWIEATIIEALEAKGLWPAEECPRSREAVRHVAHLVWGELCGSLWENWAV